MREDCASKIKKIKLKKKKINLHQKDHPANYFFCLCEACWCPTALILKALLLKYHFSSEEEQQCCETPRYSQGAPSIPICLFHLVLHHFHIHQPSNSGSPISSSSSPQQPDESGKQGWQQSHSIFPTV